MLSEKEAKKLKDSLTDFEAARRDDLAQAARDELAIVSVYLPEQMSEGDVRSLIGKMVEGGLDLSNRGVAIGAIMKEVQGKADGALVARIVGELV